MNILETVLEILKYSIPAIIVYLLIKRFLNQQLVIEEIKRKSNLRNETLLLRMQAYERLILFCERIRLGQLVVRLRQDNMSMSDLKNAILISVQKEFEHNLTQQIFVSSQLWEMIELLKNQTISMVTATYVENEKSSITEFVNGILNRDKLIENSFTSKVKEAIKKEVEIFFQ